MVRLPFNTLLRHRLALNHLVVDYSEKQHVAKFLVVVNTLMLVSSVNVNIPFDSKGTIFKIYLIL